MGGGGDVTVFVVLVFMVDEDYVMVVIIVNVFMNHNWRLMMKEQNRKIKEYSL